MAFLVSLALSALFVISTFNIIDLPSSLKLGLISGILASLAAIASLIGFFLTHKIGDSYLPSLIIFLTITISTALAIFETGETTSPLIALWALLAFMAGIFGAYGWISILAGTGAATGLWYVSGDLNETNIGLVLLIGLMPMIGGILVWREHHESESESNRNAKNLANQLSQVANKSEIIINAIGDGVIAMDAKGTVELINPAGQEILGWPKQDALMLHYKSILKLSSEDNQEIDPSQDPVQAVLNTNQEARGNKLTAVTQSGKRINISLVVSPIGETGSGVIAVFRDITKERSEEREQAEFISTASHEMRTPVASIEGYLGLALNPNTAQIDDRARGFIVKAQESAQHLGRLFQDLLDVSKSEDGRMANIPKVINMTELTETIVEGLAPKAQEKGVRLYFRPNENEGQKKIMPVIYANQDNDHIREVLNNLVENAIKYTIKGEVVVDIEGTDNKVIISVKDTGLGIPAEDIPHLFQKFYRVSNMDRQEIGGTGLGLYLSRRLAESMQGRLWVESVYGQGSTFFFELPRIDSTEAESLKQEQAAQVGGHKIKVNDAPEFVPDMTPVSHEESVATAAAPPAGTAATAQPIAAPATASSSAQTGEATQAPTQTTSRNEIDGSARQQSTGVRPATTVPRGEVLTAEQKAARVKQLEELARKQREQNGERSGA